MSTTLEAPRSSAPILLSARVDRATPRVVRSFRPDIEGLRAVAVTLVVLSHLGLGFPGGYIGVDVFFVISGFLITRQLFNVSTGTKRISLREFYARRARRILPAATVVIVGTTLACWKWDSPLRVKADAVNGLFSAISGVNWHLAATGTNYFQAALPPSPFQHFWSLAVEEQFYAVWPALLLVIGVVAGRRYGRRASVVWSLLLVIAVSLFLSVATTGSSPSWAYFGSQTRAWELALGALIAVTVDVWTRMPPALASQMSWLGLGLIVLAALDYGPSTAFPGVAVVLPVVGSAFVIAGGCPGWSRSGEMLLKRRPMQFLGKTSYSWYLVHWPVITILPLALGRDLSTNDKWLALFGSLGLAVALFHVVERPIRTQRWLVPKPKVSLLLGGVFVLASICTAVVVFNRAVIPEGGVGSGQIAAATTDVSTLEQAIATGASTRALPAHLTPALAAAGSDHPASSDRCLVADTVSTPVPDSQCTFGDVHSSRTIAVVGDSHANQWTPAFDSFGKADHWRIILYAKAACSPGLYPSYVDPITQRLYTQCNQWRTAIYSKVLSLKPKFVIVASELRTIEIDPEGMVQSIRNFEASGARVIYLEDTPNPGNVGSVPDCLARNPRAVESCALPRRAPATRLSGMIQRRVEDAAVQRAGAILLDPTDWFCTSSVCPPIIADRVVYQDDSHITATYAKWVSPVMSAALAKITG